MRRLAVFALVISLAALACGDAGGTAAAGPVSSLKGHVRGRVLTTDGRPVAGAHVQVANQDYPEGPIVDTGKDGVYDAKGPAGNYRVYGWVDPVFEGNKYLFPLDPVGGSTNFRIEQGYVKDFVWKLSGTNPQMAASNDRLSLYGTYLTINPYDTTYKKTAVAQGTPVTVTLAPAGPLPDGTKPATLTKQAQWGLFGVEIDDVPVGKWTLTIKAGGTPLKVAACVPHCPSGAPLGSSATFVVPPSQTQHVPPTASAGQPTEIDTGL